MVARTARRAVVPDGAGRRAEAQLADGHVDEAVDGMAAVSLVVDDDEPTVGPAVDDLADVKEHGGQVSPCWAVAP